MANRFQSGAAVNSGYYLNAARWAIQPVARDGERLPEGKGDWMKIPTLLALVLTPVLGLTFLMFLPFIGFALLLAHVASPVLKLFRRSATELAGTMSPGWQPGEAHLTGKAPEKTEAAPAAKDEKLDALQGEIDARRK
ncbi:MAG: hypothetical protein QM767_08670 [Anaeromyxobacter sp.]